MTRRPALFARVFVPGLLLGTGLIPSATWGAAPDGSPGIDGIDQSVVSGPLDGNTGGVGGAGSTGAAGSETGGAGGTGGKGGFVVTTTTGNATGGLGGTGGVGGQGGPAASVSSTITNSTTISGGTGGSGGVGGEGGDGSALTSGTGSGAFGGNGGVGGAGGSGITASGGATVINTGTISGGAGGVGGTGGRGGDAVAGGGVLSRANGGFGGGGGNGGNGGAGISGSNVTVINSGTISGGTSGGGGAGGLGGDAFAFQGIADDGANGLGGTAGLSGGAGITGANLTIINSGTISGGLGFGGAASPIAFTGGINVLELQSGSTIIGNVSAFSTADTLRLGGAVNASFDTSLIGPAGQFQNFGIFEKTGSGTWALTNAPGQTTSWTITQGALAVANAASLGGGSLTFNGGMLQATATLSLTNPIAINAGGGTIDSNGNNVTVSSAISGVGGLTKNGAGELRLQAAGTYGGGTTVNAGTLVLDTVGGSLPVGGALTVNGGLFDMSQIATGQTVGALAGIGGVISLGTNTLTTSSSASTTLATTITGTGGLVKQGGGVLTLTSNNAYSGGTIILGGLVNFSTLGNFGTGTITLNGGGLQWAGGSTTDVSSRLAPLGAAGGTLDTNGNTVTLVNAIGGNGGLTKAGAGTLILGGNNTYAGGTTVSGGTLQGTTASLQGNIANNANVTFHQGTAGTYAGNMSGTGSLTVQGGGTLMLGGTNSYTGGTALLGGALIGNTASLQGNIANNGSVTFNQSGSGTYAGAMSGTGGLTLQGGGTLAMTGASTYTGATAVNASNLVVNGSLASVVTLNGGSTLGGSGTIGGLFANGATLAPGNSIGTLNVNGNFSQTGGTYVVETNGQGQSDRINVAGTATINGGTVQVLAQPGSYGPSTTYTILTANGGRTGTYAGVSANFAFLTPSLTYDANNAYLTLALLTNGNPGSGGGFLMSAFTPNQKAVGSALNQSFATASGDYATVIGALAGLSASQGPAALNAISGEQYADFGTMNLNNSALFMNAMGQQMALARGTIAASGQRASLAQACDVSACDGVSPFSVWGSVLGGVGSASGDTNASTATYNFGGAAVGIDYRLDPRFLVGLASTYTAGNLWVNSFPGKGWSNNVGVAAYGSFALDGFYADLLGGYAYFNNQLQRQIVISGLPTRTSSGSTGANQALGQVETGYRMPVYQPASATVAPFARLQGSSTTQSAFSEWGAQSLSLNVAQQTTNSLRSLFGIDLAGALPLGSKRTLDLGLRLGWQHEYAYTGRPITAALGGAPFAAFTVYGATPQPDSAVVSLRASTRIAEQVQLYLRYDGDIGSGTDNHALNLGIRASW
ncbi:autotransporter-associated beta strand repeat-containing protein [Rhodospirillales bacterium URHD0017]|nr:autotransporter-associated beta strand repeat-containing protein [Rhodospirillales bacterium URHD0017]